MFKIKRIIHNSTKEEYMTQKELSYYEDAIGHEDNIIKILEYSLQTLEDENLISFMESEVNKHNQIKEKLMNLLEEKNNG